MTSHAAIDRDADFERARALDLSGRIAEAEAEYLALLRRFPGHPELLGHLATVLLKLGRIDESIGRFEAALAADPDQVKALTNGAYALVQSNRPAAALEYLDRLIVLNPQSAGGYVNRAMVLQALGRAGDALADFDRAIEIAPMLAVAHFNRGAVLLGLKRQDEAVASYDRALAMQPDVAEIWNNRGAALAELARPEDALASYDRALALRPDYVDAWGNRGIALQALKRPEEALASHQRALAADPGNAAEWNNTGNALLALGRHDEALAAYERALALKPDFAEAHNNRGSVLQRLKRPSEALPCFDAALTLRPHYLDALRNRSLVLLEMHRPEEAIACCGRVLALAPDAAEPWFDQGNALAALHRYDDAAASYARAGALRPDYVEAFVHQGNVLAFLQRHEEALACYERALALDPEYPGAHQNRGSILSLLRRHAEALASFERALQLDPHMDYLLGSWLRERLNVCAWEGLGQARARLEEFAGERKMAAPFLVLGVTGRAAVQRKVAETWVRERHPADGSLPPIAARPACNQVRLAYFSSDFREHAVCYLMAELFERHDRSRFRVTAFSLGPDPGDPMRRRVAAAFDEFIDLRGKSDREAASLARERGIDIAVDLNGHTQDSRTGIFALRAAPVQVNYLGYPGTMGAPYIDYVIADRYLIPEALFDRYCERVVWLPDTFQANDSTRRIAEQVPTREDFGLPAAGFVFCCFNASYKIAPELFAVWMRLLLAVPGSVLWLLGGDCEANLRREALVRGVDPQRLVFAPALPYVDYLARYTRADLFLDTLPFNGGTTTSDALWAGLPVLTCSGEAFAARMAGSLLHAAGLPELVTDNLDAYERMAVRLARESGTLAEIRLRWHAGRLRSALFDSDRFRRNIEAAYLGMWARFQRGQPPATFEV